MVLLALVYARHSLKGRGKESDKLGQGSISKWRRAWFIVDYRQDLQFNVSSKIPWQDEDSCSPDRPECVQELGEAALVLRKHLECLLPIWGAAESGKAVEGDHRAASQGQEGKRVWEVWPWLEGTGVEACWMPISGGRGWWSTIKVPQGSRVNETGSKHHPQARARWHSRPQSSICKYPPSPPFLSCKDSHACEFLLSQIGLFAIPLRCDTFAIPLRCELHRKDRYMAFWRFGLR